jgi:hypothetical protein
MPQPPQLAKAFKPRWSSRPIAETLQSIRICDLRICSLSPDKTYTIGTQIKWPFVASIKLGWDFIEFHFPSLHRGQLGPVQTFQVKPLKTGFGVRHAVICECGKSTTKLYCIQRHLACARCHRVRYASQKLGSKTRPILQASRLQAFLDSRPKLKHARQRLEQRLGLKLMQAQSRFSTRTTHQG